MSLCDPLFDALLELRNHEAALHVARLAPADPDGALDWQPPAPLPQAGLHAPRRINPPTRRLQRLAWDAAAAGRPVALCAAGLEALGVPPATARQLLRRDLATLAGMSYAPHPRLMEVWLLSETGRTPAPGLLPWDMEEPPPGWIAILPAQPGWTDPPSAAEWRKNLRASTRRLAAEERAEAKRLATEAKRAGKKAAPKMPTR